MKVFVAGASGTIGRRLIPMLVRAGHVVVGMTRSPGKADIIRAAGAEPVVADALDEDAVLAAVRHAGPEVVVHQLTASRPGSTSGHSSGTSRSPTAYASKALGTWRPRRARPAPADSWRRASPGGPTRGRADQ